MLATFESIAPIFLVLLVGVGLRRTPLFGDGFWQGLDRLGFFVLYPVLLFSTILKADFGALSLGLIVSASLSSLAALMIGTLALWPLCKRSGMPGATYSTLFQTTVRWNGFIALAIAEKLFPSEGVALVALIMAVVVIPINLASVTIVATMGTTASSGSGLIARLVTNPFIVAVASALVLRALPFGLPMIIDDALHLLARAALGMGLLAIGAGLRIGKQNVSASIMALPIGLKLFVYPAITLTLALIFGLPAVQIEWLMLCAAVPTAMNGYVLAKQMGGDAETYAIVVTLQTALAFVTIPAVLAVTSMLIGM